MILYTDTERRLLRILSDGNPHLKDELKDVMNEGQDCSDHNLSQFILRINEKLSHIGQKVVCINNGRQKQARYQHIRTLHGPEDHRNTSRRNVDNFGRKINRVSIEENNNGSETTEE